MRKMAAIQHENNNQNNVEIKMEHPSDEQPRELDMPMHPEMPIHADVAPYQRPFRDHPGVWRRPPSRRMRVMQRTDALVELLYSMANNPGRWLDRLNEEFADYDGYRDDGDDRGWAANREGAVNREGAANRGWGGVYRGRGGNWSRGGPYRGRGSFYRGRGGEHQRRGGY